mmetsp:Transcript_6338/g.877  ORF Transcript_6338/g.877 Transcript_6338/m.877 type:complete len:81 (+) Transcript_6338:385-627(+)
MVFVTLFFFSNHFRSYRPFFPLYFFFFYYLSIRFRPRTGYSIYFVILRLLLLFALVLLSYIIGKLLFKGFFHTKISTSFT